MVEPDLFHVVKEAVNIPMVNWDFGLLSFVTPIIVNVYAFV